MLHCLAPLVFELDVGATQLIALLVLVLLRDSGFLRHHRYDLEARLVIPAQNDALTLIHLLHCLFFKIPLVVLVAAS